MSAHESPKHEPSKPAAVQLSPAAESSDPDVHQLLARRQAAVSNLADATADEAAKAKADEARKQVEEIDKQLADLGVSAS